MKINKTAYDTTPRYFWLGAEGIEVLDEKGFQDRIDDLSERERRWREVDLTDTDPQPDDEQLELFPVEDNDD